MYAQKPNYIERGQSRKIWKSPETETFSVACQRMSQNSPFPNAKHIRQLKIYRLRAWSPGIPYFKDVDHPSVLGSRVISSAKAIGTARIIGLSFWVCRKG
jgi:hypothetical protein